MKRQTKLVDCGTTVFVYDYTSTRNHEKHSFEKGSNGTITDFKRLFIKNFINENLEINLNFTLPLELNDLPNAQGIFEEFSTSLQDIFNQASVKCLAVLQLPLESSSNQPSIRIVTDIDYFEATKYFDPNLDEEELDRLLEERMTQLWGSQVFVDTTNEEMEVKSLVDVLTNTLLSPLCTKQTHTIFKSNLKRPKVLRNEKADEHIKRRNLLEFPRQSSTEIYNKVGGFIIVNIYSKC
ncbi:hypothetical protein [Neobacillus sp. OS1-33]|uniref:hypothetical protein n=1 Tax=Neobacillus sp. OS1-33 TaxID=3070683 RepID=UPI0027DF4899|nr:hypothetical protein [Neobacillus sp. OS1-33]WML26287.1 hypothetical protein RCG22_01175 [Neobacillus sp. OS1-33]